MEIRHIDCFSGLGGICTGFKSAGIKTILAIEKVGSCVETYSANHPEVPVSHGDIRNIRKRDLKHLVKDFRADILTSGMPCETFSTAGSKSRRSYDHRQKLYKEAIRIADYFNIKVILFENVIGFKNKRIDKSPNSKLIYGQLKEDLNNAGYHNQASYTLNAKDYGIPQYRERFFHLAAKKASVSFVPATSTLSGKRQTVRDAFSGLSNIDANKGENGTLKRMKLSKYVSLLRDNEFWKIHPKLINGMVTYHIAPNHRPTTIERFKLIDSGEGLKDLFEKLSSTKLMNLQRKNILPAKWYIQRNRRLTQNQVSPTVTSHCIDELLHPTLNRAITVREAARLQSFPDAYDFVGGPMICPHIYETQDKYEQIGDAVPPILAYEWAIVLKRIIKRLGR